MKLLFLDSTHPSLKSELERNGFTCEEDFTSTKEEIEKKLSHYNGIILRSRINIDSELIDAFVQSPTPFPSPHGEGCVLRFIARVGAGMEHIDVAYAESKGVKCISSPEGNRQAVAEHALGMLLNLLNNISKANAEVKTGQWLREPNRGTELSGKTIGIYGYGNTGSAFAKVLSGFDVRVLAYDKYRAVSPPSKGGAAGGGLAASPPSKGGAAGGGLAVSPPPGEGVSDRGSASVMGGGGLYESSPEEIFSQADILSLHLPLNEETKYLVNDSFLSKFKKNIYLINTSRGPIVKTDDLVKNLKSGKILGACLDVLEYEETSFEAVKPATSGQPPEAFQYLLESIKVILTPHIAGWSFESTQKMVNILAEKILTFVRSQQ